LQFDFAKLVASATITKKTNAIRVTLTGTIDGKEKELM
jgi:hypothetical protein